PPLVTGAIEGDDGGSVEAERLPVEVPALRSVLADDGRPVGAVQFTLPAPGLDPIGTDVRWATDSVRSAVLQPLLGTVTTDDRRPVHPVELPVAIEPGHRPIRSDPRRRVIRWIRLLWWRPGRTGRFGLAFAKVNGDLIVG